MLIINLVLILALKLKADKVSRKSEYEKGVLKVIYTWLWLPIVLVIASIVLYGLLNAILRSTDNASISSNILTITNSLLYLTGLISILILPILSWIFAYVYYSKLKHQNATRHEIHKYKKSDMVSLREEVEQLKKDSNHANSKSSLLLGIAFGVSCTVLIAMAVYGYTFVKNTQKQVVSLIEKNNGLQEEVIAAQNEAERVSRRNDELQREVGELRSRSNQTYSQPKTIAPTQQPTDVQALKDQINSLTPKKTSCSPDIFGGFTCTSY